MVEIVPSVKIKTKWDISGIIGIVNGIRQKPNSVHLPHLKDQKWTESAVAGVCDF